MKTWILLALTAAVVLAACGDPAGEGADASALEGSWELVDGHGPEGPVPLVDGHPITLGFDLGAGTAGGAAACNSYGGDVTVDGGAIAIAELSYTEMACMPDEVMASEQAYLAALPRADAWAVDGDRLVLSGDGVELEFERLPEPENQPLLGTTWVLDTLIQGEAASSLPDTDRPLTLELAKDGAFQAFTGCNTIDGRFSAGDDRVDLTPLARTDAACPGLEPLEDHILAVLQGDVGVDIQANRLTLTADDGLGLSYRAEA